jgi:hypothetical protein
VERTRIMVDCTGWIEPLNLECLLVNTLAGSSDVFIFISLMFIAGMGAYFRMINTTMFIMFALFAVLMGTLLSGILLLIVLIGGVAAAYTISQVVK